MTKKNNTKTSTMKNQSNLYHENSAVIINKFHNYITNFNRSLNKKLSHAHI